MFMLYSALFAAGNDTSNYRSLIKEWAGSWKSSLVAKAIKKANSHKKQIVIPPRVHASRLLAGPVGVA
jgi:hypothetical protein